MRQLFPFVILIILTSCSSTTYYYLVRHGEKESGSGTEKMSTAGDPDLSEEGKQRAIALSEELKDKDVRYIFSTATHRTIETAEPLQKLMNIKLILYDHHDTLDQFISRIKSIKKGNVVIIGHSNSVDDIANRLCGKTVIPGDLKDTEYDNLFVIKRIGNKFSFERREYGSRSK